MTVERKCRLAQTSALIAGQNCALWRRRSSSGRAGRIGRRPSVFSHNGLEARVFQGVVAQLLVKILNHQRILIEFLYELPRGRLGVCQFGV